MKPATDGRSADTGRSGLSEPLGIKPGRSALIAVAAGLGAGVFARLLFTVFPEPWDTLANTSALWGLVPFFVALGVRARGWFGATLGVISLATMVSTWVVLSPAVVTPRELVMWFAAALLAGASCGLAGSLTRSARVWFRRSALAFMSGLILGEGLYGILVIDGPQWWAEIFIGLAVPLVLMRRWADRVIGVAGASVVACALFAAFLLYDAIAVA